MSARLIYEFSTQQLAYFGFRSLNKATIRAEFHGPKHLLFRRYRQFRRKFEAPLTSYLINQPMVIAPCGEDSWVASNRLFPVVPNAQPPVTQIPSGTFSTPSTFPIGRMGGNIGVLRIRWAQMAGLIRARVPDYGGPVAEIRLSSVY